MLQLISPQLCTTARRSVLLSPQQYQTFWGCLGADTRLVAEYLTRLIDKLVKSQKLIKRGKEWRPRKPGREFADIAEVAKELHGDDLRKHEAMLDYHTVGGGRGDRHMQPHNNSLYSCSRFVYTVALCKTNWI